ncbi:MAG: ABC transporter ATP-binding protein [Chloroflexi bacterium]|nr:ABC transporter ATP-binding protein [Chloroflexota bacterium]
MNISAGEIFGLVGPDGAGKTTTMRLLCGAIKVDSGQINIAGFDIIKQTEQARAQIGYLPQKFSLYEELTVLENLRFFAEVRGLKAEEWKPRCMEILEFIGLEDFTNRWAGKLSGGMKQKLGLAAALVHEPQVLLLDEPTTGVDPVTRQDFWRLIIRLAARGDVVVLVTTPYMDEASRCTRLGFMKDGRLLLEGTPDKLRAQLRGRIMELRGTPLPLLRRLAVQDPDVEDARMFGDRIHLRVHIGAHEEITNRLEKEIAANRGMMTHLQVVPPQLEDIFMELSVMDSDG